MSTAHTPAGQLWLALDRVHAVMARRVHGVMAEYGLTVPQYRVLRLLADDGPLSANTLAERIGVTPGNLTGILDRLETAGFLKRNRDEDDRRCLRASITDAGRDLMARCVPSVRGHVAALFAPLSDDEVAETHRILNRLEAHLGEQPTRAAREEVPA